MRPPSMADLRLVFGASLLCGLCACAAPDPQTSESSAPPPPSVPDGVLEEKAASLGIRTTFEDGASAEKRMFETMGGGVALFDADGDGDLDLFAPAGGQGAATAEATTRQALYRNDGRGRFTDVTEISGLASPTGAFAVGAAAGDFDGDGDLDLYVACLGPDRLYRNDDGRFTELPGALGASDPEWSVAPLFFDADGDDDLDLYVAAYVRYERAEELPCTYGGVRTYCTPDLFEAAADRFYRNEGGRFVAESFEGGKGLAAVAVDFEGDGDPDVYVANDTTPNLLLINESGRFTDEGLWRGGALGRDGREKAGMGVAVFDFDRDADHDLLVTNFSRETYDLYRQDEGFLTEVADRHGVARTTADALGFGVVAADFDLDGWTDLALAGGHINDLADELLHGEAFRQPNLLLRNVEGTFERWPQREGDFVRADVARGLAAGDLDGDGDVDLAMSRLRDPLAVFLSAGAPTNRWVALRVQLGTWVTVRTAAGRELKEHVAGGSYASQSEDILRFGLGAEMPEEIVVASGRRGARRIVGAPTDRLLVVR